MKSKKLLTETLMKRFTYHTFTSAAFLFPKKIIKVMNPYNVTMELQGFHTLGEMIVNHLSTDYNVRVIEKIDEREFKKIMLWTANYV